MSMPRWHEEPIRKRHDREGFDCGVPALNEFLHKHARQSHAAGGAKTFVAVEDADAGGRTVLGYYSLCPASVEFARTPEVAKRGLGRHEVPGFRLARLAVSLDLQGQGLGGQLLLAAGRRCLRAAEEVGGAVLVIDAKDEAAARWYRRFGAISLNDTPLTLVLPMATIAAALRAVR